MTMISVVRVLFVTVAFSAVPAFAAEVKPQPVMITPITLDGQINLLDCALQALGRNAVTKLSGVGVFSPR